MFKPVQVLNVGSLNIDRVFRVPHLVQPGETLTSRSLQTFAGGKGANQSMALARAGVKVAHCGRVGHDGIWLIDKLAAEGIDTQSIVRCDSANGQAIIQVADNGQNAIVLLPGTNYELTDTQIDMALDDYAACVFVLTQNETNCVPYLIESAVRRGLPVVFNPAPFTPAVLDYPLEHVSLLIVNESEGASLTAQASPDAILAKLRDKFAATDVILTLGAAGAMYDGREGRLHVPAANVHVVDTTAAGDTFIGYFLAARLQGRTVEQSLEIAGAAAAICVGRAGAIDSIPRWSELAIH